MTLTSGMWCIDRVREIQMRITYKPGTGFYIDEKEGLVFIQHWQLLPDCKMDGYRTEQRGRKFYISPYMTDEEIVRTFALAVKVFEEHEANEWLKLDGERVLNPHPEGPRPPQVREAG